LLLVLPAAAMAAPPQPVADALALLAAGSSRLAAGWRYQQKVTSDQGSETLAYDAARPGGERWKVLTVNGKQPSPEKARTLANKMRAAHRKGKQSGGVSLSVGNWLQASRYRLIRSTGTQLVYQIEMHAGTHDSASADKMLKHLSGRLVVARSDHRPLELTLDNFESFSPRFGVKVTRFRLQIHFRRLGVKAPVVADRVSTVAQGKVFWIKSFNTQTQVTLSHFAPVAASAPAPAGH
jgi:hypothetical protein